MTSPWWTITQSIDESKLSFKELLLSAKISSTACCDALALARAAVEIGQHCQDPSAAFFTGYQLAMRCLDPALEPDQWAALCVNEKDVTSLRRMSTTWCARTNQLNGHKSFALLAGHGLDQAVVIARPAGQDEASDIHDLIALKIYLPSPQITTTVPQKPSKILPGLPHGSLDFRQYQVNDVWQKDAHHSINKPFRYWEDVMVVLAFSGWMMGHLGADKSHALSVEVESLIKAFSTQHQAYSLHSLDRFERVQIQLSEIESLLPTSALAAWQRDQQILTLGQRVRDKLKHQLLSNH